MSQSTDQAIPVRPQPATDGQCRYFRGPVSIYTVTREGETLAKYLPYYFPNAGAVVKDMMRRIGPDADDDAADFAVWFDGRLVAVVHANFDDSTDRFRVVMFDEANNDPASPSDECNPPMPGYPTRAEWLLDGFGLADGDIPIRLRYVDDPKLGRTLRWDHDQDADAP